MARKVTIRRGLIADLPVLDIGELGFALDTSELFIGSEVGNILFAKKSELDLINTEINGIKESDVFTRLSISENGVLMIDGVEQSTNGGGEEMTLVVKDYFEGSTNITKTYTDSMVGFDITNDDATTGLTFTINGLTIPVKASESYNANFAPYKTVTITTTAPYRATVSMPFGTTIDTIAPSNVTGLTFSNVTETSIDLSWVASTSTDTAGYEIYKGTTLVATISETNYSATGLTQNTNYTFTVKAKDNSNNVANGVSISTSTLADLTAPNEITNLATSNVTATTLTLSWTASNSSDVNGYEIHKDGSLLTTVTGTTYNVSGLTASTQYTFIVKAKDNSNNISTGISTTVTTSAVADTTAPENVANLTTSNLSTTSVTLNWNASISPDVTGYDIYNGETLVTNTANTSYTVTGLTAATQYTFYVKAKDGANNVASGTSVMVSTIDNIAPNNVTNLTTSNVTHTGLTLTWTASTSLDIANYEVYNGASLITTVTGTTYNVTGLTASTVYTFWVKSKDTSNNVSSGTSVGVTTLAPIDTTVPVLTITPATSFTTIQQVTMSTNETSTIYYTLDGIEPTTASTVYSTPFNLSDTTTIKAFAKDTAGNSSAVQTVIFTKSVGGTPLVSDSFNRANVTPSANTTTSLGTTEVGSKVWTNQSQFLAYGITSNQAYLAFINNGGSKYVYPVTVPVASKNYSVQVTYATLDSTNANESLYVRFGTDKVYLKRVSTKYELTKSSGSPVLIRGGTVVPKSTDVIKIETYESGRIRVFVNDILDIDVIDAIGILETNTVGFGTDSNVSRFEDFQVKEIGAYIPDSEAPANPTGFTIQPASTNNSLTMYWNKTVSKDWMEYEVYHGATKLGTVTPSDSTGTIYFTAEGLSPATSYTLTVKTKDFDGNLSGGVSATRSTLA